MFGRKERNSPYQREPIAKLEDLRDDCIALFINSGLTQEAVHQRGGPTPATISKWLYKETRFPRLDTMRALMKALGADLVIMPADAAKAWRQRPLQERLALDVAFARKPHMPPKRSKAA